jgi:hypothetical protein
MTDQNAIRARLKSTYDHSIDAAIVHRRLWFSYRRCEDQVVAVQIDNVSSRG